MLSPYPQAAVPTASASAPNISPSAASTSSKPGRFALSGSRQAATRACRRIGGGESGAGGAVRRGSWSRKPPKCSALPPPMHRLARPGDTQRRHRAKEMSWSTAVRLLAAHLVGWRHARRQGPQPPPQRADLHNRRVSSNAAQSDPACDQAVQQVLPVPEPMVNRHRRQPSAELQSAEQGASPTW